MVKEAMLYIVTAPSGAGKSSLLKALIEPDSSAVVSVSYTTRPPRPGEIEGVDYNFVSKTEFEKMIAQDQFLEHAVVFPQVANYYYGTCRHQVEERLRAGKKVVLEIDWQGARQVFIKMPQAVGIFILPPSLQILAARLTERAQDDERTIHKRMSVAQDEISHYRDYHYLVINDDFKQALTELDAIFQGQRQPIDWKVKQLPEGLHQLLNDLLT